VSEPTNGSALDGDASDQSTGAPGDGTQSSRSSHRRRSERHAGKSHRHPWLRRAAFGVSGLLVVALVLGIAAYVKLNGNIQRLDITSALGDRPQQEATTDAKTNLAPLNIFVMGSDSREGTNLGKGQTEYGMEGSRSDTNLIVHLSADRQSAIVVSIPRDSMTMAPRDCKNKADKVENGVIRQWNQNFTLGGPACTIRTFEGLTGIFIDHFVVIDFRGFQDMVNALGGVTVCLPEPVQDRQSHLDLPAGKTKVNGKNALAYVRLRHNIGDGSDLGRIDRQQAFLSSVIQEATKSSLLLRPDKLFRFLNATTSAMTTDKGLDVGEMKDIASSVSKIGTSQIRFVKLPTTTYPPDPNRVQWTAGAAPIWKAIRKDEPLPGTKVPSSTTTATAPATTEPALTVSPRDIQVRVTNNSGVAGLAKQAAAELRVQGFTITSFVTGTGAPTDGVVVRYGPDMKEAARTVAAVYPGAQIREDKLLGSTIELSMGVGSARAVEIPNRLGTTPLPKPSVTATPDPSSSASIKARTAAQDICT
jgi:LCP family protein required for cell wall assembly